MTESNVLNKLSELGQSVWYDNISRELIQGGQLAEIVSSGVKGLTSNPSIFEKAVASSSIYDSDISDFNHEDVSDIDVYEAIAIADIKSAADVLMSQYQFTNGENGFVSLEVNPHLANDTDGTIKEARRLFIDVDRPNLMIKVPGTKAGIPAIETLISEGINVNVTLIFSSEAYSEVREAYISGLEKLHAAGGDCSKVSSVASFFVSRVDTAVDTILARDLPDQKDLIGKTAIANAKVAYRDFQRSFNSDRFGSLKSVGAKVQRPLWASTSTKNPDFSDVLYVEELIGSDTVTTMPDATLEAYNDHGFPQSTIEKGVDEAIAHLNFIRNSGINLNEITDLLVEAGVKQFADSFDNLIHNISTKRKSLLTESKQ